MKSVITLAPMYNRDIEISNCKKLEVLSSLLSFSKLMTDKLAKRLGFNVSRSKPLKPRAVEFAWNLQLHSLGQGATLVPSVLLLGNSRITLIRLRSIHSRPTALHRTFSNRKFGP